MMDESKLINLQKSNKIYGVMKMGANNSDQRLIKALAGQGYNEHEISSDTGVHFAVVQSFMKFHDPEFVESDAPPTADTAHLHDKIAELNEIIKANDLQRIEDNITDPDNSEIPPPADDDE